MNEKDLFGAERKTIEEAERLLRAGTIRGDEADSHYRRLLKNYSRLLRQSQRLVKLSDRMQSDLSNLNDELRRSEAKYRNIFENAAEGVFRIRADGSFSELNQAMAGILGFDEADQFFEKDNPGYFTSFSERGAWDDFLAILGVQGRVRNYQMPIVRLNGDRIWVEISAQASCADNGDIHYIEGLLSDVTQKKKRHEELKELANTDGLTGLYNRRFFMERLNRELGRAKTRSLPLSLMMIDADHFKSVNDQYGHDVGDRVLQMLTQACRFALRGNDVIGRIGGEEFAVILPGLNLVRAKRIAERLRANVEDAVLPLKNHNIRITISIGLSRLCESACDCDRLMKYADCALYKAKRSGRNRVCVYPD